MLLFPAHMLDAMMKIPFWKSRPATFDERLATFVGKHPFASLGASAVVGAAAAVAVYEYRVVHGQGRFASRAPGTMRDAPAALTFAQVECGICMADVTADQRALLLCGHSSCCKECLTEVVARGLQERSTASLRCPDQVCNRPLTEPDVRTITNGDRRALEAYAETTMNEWIGTQPNAKLCPTPNCGLYFLNEAATKQEVTCRSCKSSYCSHCLIKHARDISCERMRAMRSAGTSDADAVWLLRNTKQCPRCDMAIQKNEGCNHMTCRRNAKGGGCGHQFCWLCLARWRTDHNCTGAARDENREGQRRRVEILKMAGRAAFGTVAYTGVVVVPLAAAFIVGKKTFNGLELVGATRFVIAPMSGLATGGATLYFYMHGVEAVWRHCFWYLLS